MTAFMDFLKPGSSSGLECRELGPTESKILESCTPYRHKVPVTNVRHENGKTLCDIDIAKLGLTDKLVLGVC